MKRIRQTGRLLAKALLACLATAPMAVAQEQMRVPPMAIYQAMLDANRQSGWVQFRNYGGAQWVYFTALQTMHCRLKEIRYSVNSRLLNERFPLVKCNPQMPFALPSDAGVEDIAIRLAPGSAKTVAVQVIWDDGSASDTAIYEPCKDVGEQTCAWPLQ